MTNSSDHQELSAPQRPKLWLLRTRRFWFGVGMLMLLIACWLLSPRYLAQASVYRSEIRGGAVYVHFFGVFIEDGLLGPFSGSYDYVPGPSDDLPNWFDWFFETSDNSSLSYIPKHWIVTETKTELSPSRTYILLPLWLPILLWLIIWPLWIRRLTRKEAAHFAKHQ
ncbi:MAG: hypothetical protein CFE26_11015 [Verrucomicrobiales bacterium VVV1]|nr:MAG: hypothetical protein CFE26_11015 [Verrucomicrobiales bacterium VVV1]